MGQKIKSISLLIMLASITTMGFASNQAFAGTGFLLPTDPANKNDPFLGDFMCYDVTDIENFQEAVTLTDQFVNLEYDVEDIIKICTMTEKQAGVDFPASEIPQIFDNQNVMEQHFIVYRLCHESSTEDNNGNTCVTPDVVDLPVSIMDQFGITVHDVPHQPVELWVPATKDAGGNLFFQAHNIHFKCYDIEPQFIGTKSLTLSNDNFAPTGVSLEIDRAKKLCNPVIKNTEISQSLEIEHLKCYEFDVPQTISPQVVNIVDQFFRGGKDLTVTAGIEFCSASDKFEIRTVGGTIISIDKTSLLLAYGLLNSWWMAPTAIGIGVGIYLVKKRSGF